MNADGHAGWIPYRHITYFTNSGDCYSSNWDQKPSGHQRPIWRPNDDDKVLAPVLTLPSALPLGLLKVLLTFSFPPKWILVIDGHVPGPQKALIWPQHVSSPLSKQACHGSLLQCSMLEMFELLPSISPLPSSRCSANFVALRVKETIEQQLLAASGRRMGAGWVMDDATAAAVEGRWSALTREPSVTALTDEGQAANIDMRLTVSKTISAAESPSKTLTPPFLRLTAGWHQLTVLNEGSEPKTRQNFSGRRLSWVALAKKKTKKQSHFILG